RLPSDKLGHMSLRYNGFSPSSSLVVCWSCRYSLELQSCLAKTGVFDRKVPLSVRTEKGHHFWPIN
ncbi:hypothetical protein LTR40_012393, partial [Exophiala xenobiotica]